MKLPAIILVLGILVSTVVAVVIVRALLSRFVRGRSRGAETFATDRPSHAAQAQSRDVAKLVEALNRPAILIRTTSEASTSFFGGLPPDYPGFVWPRRDGRPLSFLACIDLAKIGSSLDWLPGGGLLLFFYDTVEQPWGFDPSDRGAWSVMHIRDVSVVRGSASAPEGLGDDLRIPRRSVRFEEASLPPSWEEDALAALDLSDQEEEALMDLRSSIYGDSPAHQLGGYPEPIQAPDMALECQLVSHGLSCGDPSGYRDPRVEELGAGAADWRLLLQMDSDEELDLMWGDAGMIYFWVRAAEASEGDFSDAWLVLQCH